MFQWAVKVATAGRDTDATWEMAKKTTPWPHKMKALQRAGRKRQQTHRAKYKNPEDSVWPQWAEEPLRRLLGVPFGGDIPDDIKEKFLKWLVPVRKDLRRRSGCMINCGRSSRTYIASIHFCWNPA